MLCLDIQTGITNLCLVNGHWCLCQFCKCYIETPCHALLDCIASEELILLRIEFWVAILLIAPGLHGNLSHEHVLQLLLQHESTAEMLAKYAHNVQHVYERICMWCIMFPMKMTLFKDHVQHLPILDKML